MSSIASLSNDSKPFADKRKSKTPKEFNLNSHYRVLMEGPDAGRTLGNIRDPIYGQNGGFSEAERSFLDPQVSACYLLKVFAVLTKDICFKLPKRRVLKKREQKKSQEIAEFLHFTLEKIKPSDMQLRFDLLTCSYFGHSFVERVYDVIKTESRKYRGYTYYSRAKAKRPGLWAFSFDENGNVNGYQSLINNRFKADIRQIMSMSWLPLWGNPYGTGDYLKVRRFEKAKREFIIFMLSLGARQSKGKQNIVKGEADLSDDNDAEHEQLLDDLNNYLSVYIPKKYDLQFEKFDTKALEDFLKVLRWLDTQIATAMLSNSMTTNQNESSGSYAMADAQIQHGTVSFENYACRIMEACLDDQYAEDLIRLNYDLEEYPEEIWPKCELITPEHIDLKYQAELDTILDNLGVYDLSTKTDLKHLRDKYNLPENPELFSEDKNNLEKMKPEDILLIVKKLESQLGVSGFARKLQEILSGQGVLNDNYPDYENMDNTDQTEEDNAETEDEPPETI